MKRHRKDVCTHSRRLMYSWSLRSEPCWTPPSGERTGHVIRPICDSLESTVFKQVGKEATVAIMLTSWCVLSVYRTCQRSSKIPAGKINKPTFHGEAGFLILYKFAERLLSVASSGGISSSVCFMFY